MDQILTSLSRLTSYISNRFIQFIEELVLRDAIRWTESLTGTPVFISVELSSEGYTGNTSWQPPQVGSENHGCERRDFNKSNELYVDTRSIIPNASYISEVVPSFLLKSLTLPLLGVQYAWSLGMAPWRYYFSCIRCAYVHIHRTATRLLKTLRGSSDDIGWLQRDPEMPPVQDETSRFLELLSDIRNGKHSLPDSFVYLLVPGLFSNHGPLYFVDTKKFFSKMGLACHIAKVHSEASVEHNASELKLYIEEIYWGSGKPVMLLGHSKGGIDAAAALSLYWSDLKDKVAGLALVQSPYGGTPIASDILREGQIGDKETRRILELLICKIIKGDMQALEDLTYEKRKEFIMKHKLPLDIPLLSFHSEASIAPAVFATMTQIAHAEVPPLLPKFRTTEPDSLVESLRVPVLVPISAAMAVCALHLQLRYGEKSDGLVTCRDAEVPGSVVVRPKMKLDHTWMVYSSKKKNPDEPDAREMCEALLTLLVELGKNTKREVHQVS
ncbi:uncharacterized protein LOC130715859 isoform X1 [Lotus japonicus]|uniref:uncharacterized protein LOC130715859 isoform X1 n=1 Tax=Lotus japonicus TaxID=34305 RepID=UPI00258F7461|nr:uncharacterized protein LOC130715859 isoform X1 [Lotus japonicus]XP_057421991.1 uncharacterized protein LOC130715859 isoform X1 [Lotus japonicus]